MSAQPSMVESVTSKVNDFLRGAAPREVPLAELVAAITDQPASQVRLIAQDLRKRGVISARIEEGQVLYTWVARRAASEEPLRVAGSQIVKPPRVHVIEDDDDNEQQDDAVAKIGANGAPQPEIRPILAPDANGELVTTTEEAMPKGVYDRAAKTRKAAKKKSVAVEAATEKQRKGRRAAAPPRAGGKPPFAVYSDGSVLITQANVTLSGEEADNLVAFIQRLRGK